MRGQGQYGILPGTGDEDAPPINLGTLRRYADTKSHRYSALCSGSIVLIQIPVPNAKPAAVARRGRIFFRTLLISDLVTQMIRSRRN